MFDKAMDFGLSLCEGYSAWIVCTLALFAFIMYKERKKIYDFHIESMNTPKEYLKEPRSTKLTDPKMIKLDKILCYLSASVCLIIYCTLVTKLVLYLLGLFIMILSGVLQIVVFLGIVVIIVGVIVMIL